MKAKEILKNADEYIAYKVNEAFPIKYDAQELANIRKAFIHGMLTALHSTQEIEFCKGDKVKLLANETGKIIKYVERLWGSFYLVKMDSDGLFHKKNELVEVFKKDLAHDIR